MSSVGHADQVGGTGRSRHPGATARRFRCRYRTRVGGRGRSRGRPVEVSRPRSPRWAPVRRGVAGHRAVGLLPDAVVAGARAGADLVARRAAWARPRRGSYGVGWPATNVGLWQVVTLRWVRSTPGSAAFSFAVCAKLAVHQVDGQRRVADRPHLRLPLAQRVVEEVGERLPLRRRHPRSFDAVGMIMYEYDDSG